MTRNSAMNTGFYTETDWLFKHLKLHMRREQTAYFNENWYKTIAKILVKENATYVEAINAHRIENPKASSPTKYGHQLHEHIRGMAFQSHACTLFQHWLRNHAELYDPQHSTYRDLSADISPYKFSVTNPFNGNVHTNLSLKDHPIRMERFECHMMRHSTIPVFSLLMWIPEKSVKKLHPPEWKRFKRLPLHMQDRIYLQNYHYGYSQRCDNGVGYFCYCQYTLCLTDKNGNITHVAEVSQDPQALRKYQRGDSTLVWSTQVMFFEKDTPIEGTDRNQLLINHLNLLTCLQNPKTVVTTKSNHTRQQLKQAKKRKRKLLTNKTLLVHAETLSQINPLRLRNPNAQGSKHSHSYDRAGGKAKKWVLKANLELGMEVIAKKPRKNGEGYLYLVEGTRKGTVCNPHLPPKQKEVQKVKVKSFKTP